MDGLTPRNAAGPVGPPRLRRVDAGPGPRTGARSLRGGDRGCLKLVFDLALRVQLYSSPNPPRAPEVPKLTTRVSTTATESWETPFADSQRR